MIVFKRRHL
jgi:hypothetical protein